jgi:hypothetical protein
VALVVAAAAAAARESGAKAGGGGGGEGQGTRTNEQAAGTVCSRGEAGRCGERARQTGREAGRPRRPLRKPTGWSNKRGGHTDWPPTAVLQDSGMIGLGLALRAAPCSAEFMLGGHGCARPP